MAQYAPWKWACISILIAFSELHDNAACDLLLSSNFLLRWQDGIRDGECSIADPSLYHRPVIGILSHPGDGASGRLSNATNGSYIAASYVKFVKAAGARVVPLIFNEPRKILQRKLKLVNGVLFTGGWAKEGLYLETAKEIFQHVLERNDKGEHFPLFAVFLGFEILTIIISRDMNVLEQFKGRNQVTALTFAEYASFEGTVFQRFPRTLLEKLRTECLVLQNHRYGISPKKLVENPDLSKFFKILSTNKDEEGKIYVSTVQGNRYPVTAFQWHPEKNAFEWGLSAIPHSVDAIQVTQQTANYFISEARKSSARPPAEGVLANLIYNFNPTFCGRTGKIPIIVYLFFCGKNLERLIF
ncbi:gamma-glutamyl hydrolase 2-like [Wolffia australiana]